jgi:hypothetical protein
MKSEELRLHLIKEYQAAGDDEIFSQATVAALRKCSISTVERDRWAGTGVPFRKFGHSVRYYKSDIRSWLQQHPAFLSTTQAKSLMKSEKSMEIEEVRKMENKNEDK